MNQIYHDLKENLIDLQENLIGAVNYIYNINNTIIAYSYSNKYPKLYDMSEKELLNSLKYKTTIISMVNTHKSNDISSIGYAILEELSKINNYPIKKCQNCGMYFIPNSRLDEIYCNYLKSDEKTCSEKGSTLSYNKRL